MTTAFSSDLKLRKLTLCHEGLRLPPAKMGELKKGLSTGTKKGSVHGTKKGSELKKGLN